MNPNAKTPVMVLQELTVKRGFLSPEYSVIHAKQGTHENEFHYQVTVAGISAVGIGRSKQIAKHDAASRALIVLETKGLYIPGDTPIHSPRSEPVDASPVKQVLGLNSIGNLSEICAENMLPQPIFTEISDVGPPHCKEFTYDCQLASIVTRATAGTKKHARHLAAKDMIDRIMQVLPELVAECSEDPINVPALTEQDEQAIENLYKLKEFKRPKPNLALKLPDYDKNIGNIMREFNLEFKDLQPFFNGKKTKEDLEEMLKKLELEFIFESLEDDPPMMMLVLNTAIPFSIVGKGDNLEDAKSDAISQTFKCLEILAS